MNVIEELPGGFMCCNDFGLVNVLACMNRADHHHSVAQHTHTQSMHLLCTLHVSQMNSIMQM